jgi:hypothetical protein
VGEEFRRARRNGEEWGRVAVVRASGKNWAAGRSSKELAAVNAHPGVEMSTFNYFNYFTEIEEYFQMKRGAHLLVSPLDWAILETWQHAEIPISAVMKGIDRAFESYARSRRGQSGRQLKSLAYCAEAVLDAAEEEKEAAGGSDPAANEKHKATEPFSDAELRGFLERNIEKLCAATAKAAEQQGPLESQLHAAADKLRDIRTLLDSPGELDLEDLERRLTIMEEKLSAAVAAQASDELLLTIRRELDHQLAPYKRKMTAGQIGDLERRYTKKRLFEAHGIPRLSLFYLT